MKLTAMAAQCREALQITYDRVGKTEYSVRDAAWHLLAILGHTPGENDPERDGLEPDNGSQTSDGKALRIVENALDFEAALLLERYIAIEKMLREQRKRLKPTVTISVDGVS